MNKAQKTLYKTHILVQARLRRGWTQTELAEKMGVTKKTIFRWENGSTLPLPLYRVQLCELLLVDPAEIWPLVADVLEASEE